MKMLMAFTAFICCQVKEEEEVKKANAILTQAPDDPQANLTCGKWLAFSKGDWETAIPYLSKGSDPTLKDLATRDLLLPKSIQERLAMADSWSDAAKKSPPYSRQKLYDRAAYWNSKAWPDLETSQKEKLRERFRKTLWNKTPGPVKKGLPAGWSQDGAPIAALDPSVAHGGGYSVKLQAAENKGAWGALKSPFIAAFGKTCVISAWTASDGTESVKDQIHVRLFDQAGKFITYVGPFIPVDQPIWTRIEASFEVTKEVSRIEVAVVVYSTKGVVWVDDISLKLDGKEMLDNGSLEK